MRWSDGPVTVMVGDARVLLAEMEAESAQCVVTSPPYWGLRDYRAEGQIGLEDSLDAYLEALVSVFREVRRVLRKDGTLWLNMGDAYAAGQGGRQSEAGELPPVTRRANPSPKRRPDLPNSPSGWAERSMTTRTTPARDSGLKPKDLIGLPWMLAFALRADGWWLRSDIIWSKPNPMPESVTDRPTKAHEYLFLLARSSRYYYDADATRTPYSAETKALSFETMDFARRDEYRAGQKKIKMPDGWDTGPGGHGTVHRNGREKGKTDKQRGHSRRHAGFNDRWDELSRAEQMAAGANRRTVWEIATQAFTGAHFATFPEALVEPCVRAGSREGDLVLDPFAGSGTTLAVARRLGRRAVGIELQPDYLPLIQRRVEAAALPLVEMTDDLLPM